VIYMLDVYVKHDSWNEFGKGQYASFPIRFVSPAQEDEKLAEKQKAFMTYYDEKVGLENKMMAPWIFSYEMVNGEYKP